MENTGDSQSPGTAALWGFQLKQELSEMEALGLRAQGWDLRGSLGGGPGNPTPKGKKGNKVVQTLWRVSSLLVWVC